MPITKMFDFTRGPEHYPAYLMQDLVDEKTTDKNKEGEEKEVTRTHVSNLRLVMQRRGVTAGAADVLKKYSIAPSYADKEREGIYAWRESK